jgi:hypothetical protein
MNNEEADGLVAESVASNKYNPLNHYRVKYELVKSVVLAWLRVPSTSDTDATRAKILRIHAYALEAMWLK